MLNMLKLKAVFFDLDGTLAETEILHLECFNHAFKEIGLSWEWDNHLYSHLLLIGGGVERILYYSAHYKNLNFNKDQAKKIHKIKTQCYKEKLSKPIPLRYGVLRLLKELNQNHIYTALVTTSSMESTASFIQNSIPLDIFNYVVTGDDVQNKKPHPEMYQKALTYFSLSPNSVITIEDNRAGLLSSVHNQILTIITPSYFTQNQDFSEAFCVLSHLGEPSLPFKVLSNHKFSKSYVDLELLESILNE